MDFLFLGSWKPSPENTLSRCMFCFGLGHWFPTLAPDTDPSHWLPTLAPDTHPSHWFSTLAPNPRCRPLSSQGNPCTYLELNS